MLQAPKPANQKQSGVNHCTARVHRSADHYKGELMTIGRVRRNTSVNTRPSDVAKILSGEPLVARTGATGVNFADYPQLQGYNLPEWSHMSAADAPRFTRALATLIVRRIAHPDAKQDSPASCATKGSDFSGR